MTLIVVLGMHRSGTSAVTRVLNRLGATIGDPADLDRNWENVPLREWNRRLLEAAGGAWDAPPLLSPGWAGDRSVARLAQPAVSDLDALLAVPVSAWKDPRTCLTLPFWRPHLGAAPVALVVYRHPVEVLASLRARRLPDDPDTSDAPGAPGAERFADAHGLALWERYNLDALRNAAGMPAVIADYADVLADPLAWAGETVDALAGLGARLPGDPADGVAELDPGRRHHDAGAELDHPEATSQQVDLWRRLAALPRRFDELPPDLDLPAPAAVSSEILAAHALERRRRGELRRLSGSRRALLARLARRMRPGR
ncbi:MAG: hypothetical protein M5T61_05595 [Acidimicrobiia bacterium]|nr:hypothetical protein [Acidimicrobiia bacterium]